MVVERLSRLLLVDDYEDALEMWAYFLRASGYAVVTASTGREALDQVGLIRPDLLLLDLQLPELSGIEVARRLRARAATAKIPLIAVTGLSQPREHEEARNAGFDSVLVKPCEPAALLAEVERLLSGRT
jgi:DNA-binding response OmpR family regulator